jgi:hypothetical protein
MTPAHPVKVWTVRDVRDRKTIEIKAHSQQEVVYRLMDERRIGAGEAHLLFRISLADEQTKAQLVTIQTHMHCDEIIAAFPVFVITKMADPGIRDQLAGVAGDAGNCPLVMYLMEMTGHPHWSVTSTDIFDLDRRECWRMSDLGRRIITAIDDRPGRGLCARSVSRGWSDSACYHACAVVSDQCIACADLRCAIGRGEATMVLHRADLAELTASKDNKRRQARYSAPWKCMAWHQWRSCDDFSHSIHRTICPGGIAPARA